MITVITVCYNARTSIEKTIVSVFRQRYLNYEYIFVDGQSSDGTIEIINQYAPMFRKKGVKVTIVSETDAGIYDAMNKAAGIATGEWINFLNAGDCYHDDEVLEKVAFSMNLMDARIYVGDIVYVEGFLGRRYRHEEIDKLKERMIFCHQAVFADRRLFQEKQFDLRYKYSADYDWMLHMYTAQYNFGYIDVLIADYDSCGVSNQNSTHTLGEARQIRKEHGFEPELDAIRTPINWKYRIYKKIAKIKGLAALYYKICGRDKADIFFLKNGDK